MKKIKNKRSKNKSQLVLDNKNTLSSSKLPINEAGNNPLNVEGTGWEKFTLYKGRYFLTKILASLLSSILLIVVGIGVFKNNWVPWQQMQVFVITTFSLLLSFYFGRK